MTETAVEQRARVRRIATTELRPLARPAEEARRFPAAARQAMSAAGLFGTTLPAEFGGSGHGAERFIIQQEELARVWPGSAVAATWTNLSGLLLRRFASPSLQEELIPGLARGEIFGAVAWTEPVGGSDAAAIEMRAERVDGGWRLSGSKRLIDNAAEADFIIVGAVSHPDEAPSRRLSMFVVHRGDPGYRDEGVFRTLGLRAAGLGRFSLDGCFVPDSGVLGDPGRGFHQMMAMVDLGRTGVGAICLGMAEAGLESAVDYLRTRRFGGVPLDRNDAVLARIGTLRTEIDAGRLLVERAARLVDAGVRCERESAMAKVYVSELAVDALATALHLHGGIGFTEEFDVEMLARDSHAFTIGEGTSEVLRFLIGRAEFARSKPNAE